MRAFNDRFLLANSASFKQPLFTVEIAFDTAFTDLEYFTSSSEAQHPVGASVIDGVVKNISGTSQRIDPLKFVSSVGNINFELVDKNATVTALFNAKLDADKGLREKRVRVYMGFPGLDWSDYELIQTQIITGMISGNVSYKLTCNDIQRIVKKEIFDLAETNLQTTVEDPPETALSAAITTTTGFATIPVDDTTGFASSGALLINFEIITYTGKTSNTFTGCSRGTNDSTAATHLVDARVSQTMYTVTVYDTSDFEMLEHDANYTDAPDLTVGYFKIDKEIFRYKGKTSTTFTNCLRGALNTRSAVHEVDTSKAADKRPKIEEYVYIETNAVKVIYGLLLGTLYNNPTSTNFPARWHLGMDTLWVKNSDFTGIGNDLWNNSVSNVNTGLKVRIAGVKKQDGKQFIEKEILPLIGCFMPIYAAGDVGLKRMTGVLSDAAYVAELNETNIRRDSSLAINYNHKAVANQFEMDWNWSEVREDYTRPTTFVDATSIGIHQDANPIKLRFRGLHGSLHTESVAKRILQRLRDRYAAPPAEMTIKCMPHLNSLEVGDIVRVNYSKIREHTSDNETLDKSFEVQQRTVNWQSGEVLLKLFGSTVKPGVSVLTNSSTVLADAYYTSQGGTNVNTLTNYSANAITADETLAGGNLMSGGIWYFDGDLTINAGVTLTINKNVWLLVKGHLTINGTINGAGQGSSGAVSTVVGIEAGTNNYLSAPVPPGRIHGSENWSGETAFSSPPDWQTVVTKEKYSLENFEIDYDGTNLNGLPTNLMGSSGDTGSAAFLVDGGYFFNGEGAVILDSAIGGNGGASGAGLMIISRGGSFGVNGSINISGGNGAASGDSVLYKSAYTLNASSGGPGAPGCLLWLMDGGSVTIPSINDKLTANTGISPVVGTPTRQFFGSSTPPPASNYSFYTGITTAQNMSNSAGRIQFITDNVSEGADDNEHVPEGPTGLSASSSDPTDLLTLKDGTVISRIKLSWTASTDQNVDHYVIQYTESGSGEKPRIIEDKPPRDATSAYIYPVVDGVKYFIIIKAVNTFGNFSYFKSITHTVVGKEASPSDPTGVTLTTDSANGVVIQWTNPSDADLKYIEIFQDTTSPTDPADSIGKFPSGKPGTVQKYNIPGIGAEVDVYIKIKAIDSTGNESNLVASTPTNVTTTGITASSVDFADVTGATKPDDNADVTSANQAASIAGQGALATQNTADYGSDVSGTKPPTNADNTTTAVEAGITPTTGSITNGSKIDIDFANGELNINSATWQASGIQLQYNSGTPRLYVGDGLDKFMQFDTDFKLGRDSKLLGADAYNNDGIYWHTYYDTLDGFNTYTNGGGSSVVVDGGLELTCGTNTNDEARAQRDIGIYALTETSFSKNSRFKSKIRGFNGTYYEVFIGVGALTNQHYGFSSRPSVNGNIWAECEQATTSTKIDTGVSWASASSFKLEAVFTSGTNVKFYVDGVLKATISTNLPNASNPYPISFYIKNYDGTGGAFTMLSSEYKYQQDE